MAEVVVAVGMNVFALGYACTLSLVTLGLYLVQGEYQPIFYPVNAYYFIAISAPLTLVAVRRHLQFHLFSLLASLVTFMASFVAMYSFQPASNQYQGESQPFAGVYRDNYA